MLVTPIGFRISVRFARKPIWMPTAPSKLFRITEHTFYSEDEISEIKKLHTAYKYQRESIMAFMKEQFYIPATKAGGLPVSFVEKELQIDEQLKAANKAKNDEIAKEREKFFNEMVKSKENLLYETKSKKEEKILDEALKIDDIVIKSKSNPNSFVTLENFDEIVNHAMNNPVSYEFYIDSAGNKNGRRQQMKGITNDETEVT